MKKEMLINVLQPEECRIAIVEDGVLEELYVERTSHESYTGNIYKGRIVNLEPAIQAAFVDFSVGRNGFLHVSDIEPQYFERSSLAPGEIEPAPRERDRRPNPRREGDRGRGRDPRRRPPAPEPSNPFFGPPPSDPPGVEDRYPEKPRDPDRDRDRNKDRGRDRERPDLSIRGRRDRSEPPRRHFGEGLVQPQEPWPDPEPPVEPISLQPDLPFGEEHSEPPQQTPDPHSTEWPETSERPWAEESGPQQAGSEPLPGWAPDRLFESEPFSGESADPDLVARELLEPHDPDLPPSRTHRPKPPARPDELQGPDRGRSRPEPPHATTPDLTEWPDRRTTDQESDSATGRRPRRGRGRGRPSLPSDRPQHGPSSLSEASPTSDIPPDFPPDIEGRDIDLTDLSRIDQPPRRRAGRAAIRSRGGEPEKSREAQPTSEPGPQRPGAPPFPGTVRRRSRPARPARTPPRSRKTAVANCAPSRSAIAIATERPPTDGPASLAMSLAASGFVPVIRRSGPTFFLPTRNGLNAIWSLTSRVNHAHAI